MASVFIQKHTVRTYEIVGVVRDFLLFDKTFRGIRRERLCWHCGIQFQDLDSIAVLFLKKAKNQLACKTCGDFLQEELDDDNDR